MSVAEIYEIQEIITKYNTTNKAFCGQGPGYAKSELNLVFAVTGCFVIIGITLLIFILIRW